MQFVSRGDMKVFRETSYNLSRKLLILTGLWPFTGRILNLSVRAAWCCFIVSFEVFQIVIMTHHAITIIRLVYFISFLCTMMILFTKYLIVIFLQDILKKLLVNIARWYGSTDQEEIRIFEKFGNDQKREVIIFICLAVVTVVTCQLALLSPALLNIVVPLNYSRSIRFMLVIEFKQGDDNFFLVYVYFTIACVTLMLIISTSDCIMSIMLHYHSAVYETISYRTNVAINEWLNPKNVAFEKDHRLYQQICEVMELYQNIQSDFERIMAVITTPYFIIVMMLTFSLCIYTFQAVELLHTIEHLNMSLVSVLTGLVQFAYAYRENSMSQMYIDNSLNVFHELCQTPWYRLPLKVQKLLLLALQRTSKGCVPVLCGLFLPSRKGFAWVIHLNPFNLNNNLKHTNGGINKLTNTLLEICSSRKVISRIYYHSFYFPFFFFVIVYL
ncbi:uncharacterized protein LOC143361992 isoform X1 [Halictus rubicundus]|uniref:uncharacterized protein LOC143361992 isoform X1 n=1 Tax=Halictus rubicundus TaxID=77578 RepID=UPI004035343A